ncbi:MAG TPA: 2-C-methyl-D-erythritol 4-phosphate cytidylyltransferase [Nitrospirae bacterium]|nr:2-C-methyl-D-erythritol 4-phosphate cytidylyltransferase [Nitrospirota bacterium]
MKTGVIAIVPAAGLGKRFDASGRKTFVNINGIPLLIYTLKRLHRENSITEIIPVLKQEEIEEGFELAGKYKLNKIKQIAPGGRERQDSIYNALRLIKNAGTDSPDQAVPVYQDSIVLIHDGVRPFIPEGMIDKLVDNVSDTDGVVPGIPVKETIKEVNSNGIVVSTLNRDKVRAVQTPQAFLFNTIKNAYDRAYSERFYATDDAALVERTGGRIKIIEGSPFNIKITTPEDLEIMEYVLEREQNLS